MEVQEDIFKWAIQKAGIKPIYICALNNNMSFWLIEVHMRNLEA